MWDHQRRYNAIVTGILGVIVLFALLSLSSFDLQSRLFFAVLTGIIATALAWFDYPRTVENRARKFCQKQMGSNQSFPVQVELDEQGISFKQFGNKTVHDWVTIRGIQSSSEGVDVQYANGTIGTVRARAFESPQQQREFVELASAYAREKQ